MTQLLKGEYKGGSVVLHHIIYYIQCDVRHCGVMFAMLLVTHGGQSGLLAFKFHQQAGKLHVHVHGYFFYKPELNQNWQPDTLIFQEFNFELILDCYHGSMIGFNCIFLNLFLEIKFW